MNSLPSKVSNTETVYRALLKENISRDGSVTKGAFKQDSGVSVDRDDNRDVNEIKNLLLSRLSEHFISACSLGVEEIRSVQSEVISDPKKDNKYHAHITNQDHTFRISTGVRRELARIAKIV